MAFVHDVAAASLENPPQNEGLVAWLLACPVKGFLVPIESEPTSEMSSPWA